MKEQRKKQSSSVLSPNTEQRALFTVRVLLVWAEKSLPYCRAPQPCQPEHRAPAITPHGCHSSFKHSDHSWPARLYVSPMHGWQTDICLCHQFHEHRSLGSVRRSSITSSQHNVQKQSISGIDKWQQRSDSGRQGHAGKGSFVVRKLQKPVMIRGFQKKTQANNPSTLICPEET